MTFSNESTLRRALQKFSYAGRSDCQLADDGGATPRSGANRVVGSGPWHDTEAP